MYCLHAQTCLIQGTYLACLLPASKSEPADLILEVVVSSTYSSCIAELEQNVGTFLAFLWASNWYEWYVSEGQPARALCGTRAKGFPFIQLPEVKELLYRITELIRRSVI